jgi:hypothetical protein
MREPMWLQPTSFLRTQLYNSLLALSAGNFVIGKATPTATLAVSNSPQTYTGSGQQTVTISASSVPGAKFPYSYRRSSNSN